MRALDNRAAHPLNQGVVVFHVGANVAARWDDFRAFSAADQEFFANLLPEAEAVEFTGDTAQRDVGGGPGLQAVQVLDEQDVRIAEMDPIGNPAAEELLRQLAEMGVRPDQAAQAIERLTRTRPNRQDQRIARRTSLNDRVQNETGGILGRLEINHRGRTLDPARRRQNYVWACAELNRRVNEHVGGNNADRENFTLDQLNQAHEVLPAVVRQFEEQLINAAA